MRRKLASVQTVSTVYEGAVLVLAKILPIDLLAEESREKYMDLFQKDREERRTLKTKTKLASSSVGLLINGRSSGIVITKEDGPSSWFRILGPS